MKLVGIILVVARMALAAQPDEPTSLAESRYQDGYRLLKKAEQGTTAPERIAGLRAAAQELRAAIALQPDYYLARALLAQTLFGLTRELTEPAARQQAIDQAWEQFAAAAKLPEADWRIFNAWGRFLTFIASGTIDRLAILKEARELFERASNLARWSTDKSAVNNLYGQCLYQLAAAAPTSDDKRRYLNECVERLTSAINELPASTDPVALRTLGNALLDLNRAQQALPYLQLALGHTPTNPELHYALSRAYALLGDADQALRELRVSIDSVSGTTLAALAETEPAFTAMRTRQDFRQALTTGRNLETAGPLIQEGLDFVAKSETAEALPVRIGLLKQSVASFSKAAQLQPDSATVHRLWAETLTQLARLAMDKEQRRAFAAEAAARFAVAAATPGADWQTDYSWGVLLLHVAENLTDGNSQQLDRFREATGKFEKALKRTSVAAERRTIQRELAAGLLAQAAIVHVSTQRTALLNRCLSICTELAKVKSPADESRVYGIWGRALILSGKLSQDRMQLRVAVEKLSTALAADTTNSEWEYRLATAYALLQSDEPALRHLQSCLENDPTGLYHRMAAEDLDLNRLRSLPAFFELLR